MEGQVFIAKSCVYGSSESSWLYWLS